MGVIYAIAICINYASIGHPVCQVQPNWGYFGTKGDCMDLMKRIARGDSDKEHRWLCVRRPQPMWEEDQ
jgi:hypothetical protein